MTGGKNQSAQKDCVTWLDAAFPFDIGVWDWRKPLLHVYCVVP